MRVRLPAAVGVIQDLHGFVDLVGAQARRCTGVANVTKVMGPVQGEQHRNQLGFAEDQCRVAVDSDLHFVGRHGAAQESAVEAWGIGACQ